MKTPFFVLSSGRSGSTLLSSMLNMHPNIHVPVELWGLYSTLPGTLRSYGDLAQGRNARILAGDLQRIGQLNEFEIRFNGDGFVEALMARDKTLRAVLECFYETLLQDAGKPRLGDKTPNNLPYIQSIVNIFPETKIIHLIRDGRDCALSMMKSRSGLNFHNLYELASNWSSDNKGAVDYRRRKPDACLLVRYEDLTADAEKVLREICGFLDEPFVPEMLQFNRGTFAKENAATLDHHRNLAKGILSNNVEKWRDGLSADQVKVYDSVGGEVLKVLGYAVESDERGYRWRLLRFAYRMSTMVRKVLRWVRQRRKAAWRWICVAAKKRTGRRDVRDVSSPPT